MPSKTIRFKKSTQAPQTSRLEIFRNQISLSKSDNCASPTGMKFSLLESEESFQVGVNFQSMWRVNNFEGETEISF